MAERSGVVLGVHFRSVIGSLIGAADVFAEYKREVEGMDPSGWYPWDLYCRMLTDFASSLSHRVVVSLGTLQVFKSRGVLASQGFGSADAIFRDWAAVFNANVRDAPAEDLVETMEYRPGYVALEGGFAQPAAIIEGYMRGVVEAYGGRVASFRVTPVLGRDRNRFEMEWS